MKAEHAWRGRIRKSPRQLHLGLPARIDMHVGHLTRFQFRPMTYIEQFPSPTPPTMRSRGTVPRAGDACGPEFHHRLRQPRDGGNETTSRPGATRLN